MEGLLHHFSVPSDLSRLLMEEVPRSMLLSTSPVLRPRCQRSERECRWAKRRTWTTRLVNCCTRIHRKERRLLTNPEAPGERGESLLLRCRTRLKSMRSLFCMGLAFTTCAQDVNELSLTCTAALHELEQDINTHCGRDSSPAAAISQLVH